MHKSLVTPPEIEQLAEQVLKQLHGQRYVDAMYALDEAKSKLSRELGSLTARHVFMSEYEFCQCDACRGGVLHNADCAVHNEPAMPNGPCNCGSLAKAERRYGAWLSLLVCNFALRWRNKFRRWMRCVLPPH